MFLTYACGFAYAASSMCYSVTVTGLARLASPLTLISPQWTRCARCPSMWREHPGWANVWNSISTNAGELELQTWIGTCRNDFVCIHIEIFPIAPNSLQLNNAPTQTTSTTRPSITIWKWPSTIFKIVCTLLRKPMQVTKNAFLYCYYNIVNSLLRYDWLVIIIVTCTPCTRSIQMLNNQYQSLMLDYTLSSQRDRYIAITKFRVSVLHTMVKNQMYVLHSRSVSASLLYPNVI